jgi:hypothetical protein
MYIYTHDGASPDQAPCRVMGFQYWYMHITHMYMYIYINLYLKVKSHLIERHIAPEDLHKPIELEACDRVPVSLTHMYMYIPISPYL